MDRLIEIALRVARARPSRRICRTYANEPILFALVERGLARWANAWQGSVIVAD